MKELTRQAAPARTAQPDRSNTRTETRITLALLDAYNASNENRGYDPYNAGDGKRSFNAWNAKSKRR
jgi:hypothetical protein